MDRIALFEKGKTYRDCKLKLTDRDTFMKILYQADDTFKSSEHLREITAGQDINYIVDYFSSRCSH